MTRAGKRSQGPWGFEEKAMKAVWAQGDRQGMLKLLEPNNGSCGCVMCSSNGGWVRNRAWGVAWWGAVRGACCSCRSCSLSHMRARKKYPILILLNKPPIDKKPSWGGGTLEVVRIRLLVPMVDGDREWTELHSNLRHIRRGFWGIWFLPFASLSKDVG